VLCHSFIVWEFILSVKGVGLVFPFLVIGVSTK
jgi:Na+-transporting methylmalonyl-CoA/oxaloacetate decarboxylase gamma subunit